MTVKQQSKYLLNKPPKVYSVVAIPTIGDANALMLIKVYLNIIKLLLKVVIDFHAENSERFESFDVAIVIMVDLTPRGLG
jgi:hypothetical protein